MISIYGFIHKKINFNIPEKAPVQKEPKSPEPPLKDRNSQFLVPISRYHSLCHCGPGSQNISGR